MGKRRPDSYTRRAKEQDFLARSVFKLQEIDKKERLFKHAKNIIDLGASPGSWSQYCAQKAPRAKVLAVDLNPLQFNHENVEFIQGDIEEIDLHSHMDGQKADVVLSDMAPKTTGIHETDIVRSIDLATTALNSAKNHLKPTGSFVVKLFMGEGFEEFNQEMKKRLNRLNAYAQIVLASTLEKSFLSQKIFAKQFTKKAE